SDSYRRRSSASSARPSRAARSRSIACRIASNRSWSSNGFVRNSTAPAFIARTDVGTSPWPVTNTMGISSSSSAILSCRSRPLRPGSRTSNTRQLGASVRGRVKNSCAEAKVSARNPADRSRLSNASRIDASSSTTKTTASGSGIAPLFIIRESEREGGSGTVVRRGPQPSAVALDDGAADREPHSHASGFGGVERVEESFCALRVEAAARVLHCDAHRIELTALRPDDQLSGAVLHRTHGLDRVQDQVEHHLL